MIAGEGCQAAELIDEHVADSCNFTQIGVCVEWKNCGLDPIVGAWCDPHVTIWPDC